MSTIKTNNITQLFELGQNEIFTYNKIKYKNLGRVALSGYNKCKILSGRTRGIKHINREAVL